MKRFLVIGWIAFLACSAPLARERFYIGSEPVDVALCVRGGRMGLEVLDPGQALMEPRAFVRFRDEWGRIKDTVFRLDRRGEGFYRNELICPVKSGLAQVLIEDPSGARIDGGGRGIFRYIGHERPWLFAMAISEKGRLSSSDRVEIVRMCWKEITAGGNPIAYYYIWEYDTASYSWEDAKPVLDSVLRKPNADALYAAFRIAETFGKDSLQAACAEDFVRRYPNDPRVNDPLLYLAEKSGNLEVFLREHPDDSACSIAALWSLMRKAMDDKDYERYQDYDEVLSRIRHTSPESWISLAYRGLSLLDTTGIDEFTRCLRGAEVRLSWDTLFLLYPFAKPEGRKKIERRHRQIFWVAKADYLMHFERYKEASVFLGACLDSLGENAYFSADAHFLFSLMNAQVESADTSSALLTATWLKYRGDFPSNWLDTVLSWADQRTRDSLLAFVASQLPLAPDLSERTLEGDTIRSSDLKGKIVVLNFWATWCGPCREEISALNELVKEYESDTGVIFLALTAEDSATLSRFLKETPFLYRQLVEAEEAFDAYGIMAVPTHYIISPNGVILFRKIGGLREGPGELRKLIEEVK
ncbi:MAG: TlpA disulfide reductase family protein [candidate division WOR-3 bacterium]